MKNNSKIKIYAILFGTALVLRLFLFFYLYESRGADFFDPLRQGTDQAEYGRVAINLAEHSSFSMSKEAPYSPDPARTPIFPIFLSILYWISGGFVLPTIINIFLSSLTSIIVFELAMLVLKSKKASFASGMIFAFLPYGAYLSDLIMADTLFVLFFVLFLYFFAKFIVFNKDIKYIWIILSSFLLGLSTLTRPITQFFIIIPILILFLSCFLSPKVRLKEFFFRPALFLAVFLLVLSPWLGRNYYHFNKFFLSSIGGYHLLVSYVAPWRAQKENISRNEEHAKIKNYVDEKYGPNAMYDIEVSSQIGKEAKKEILKDPLSYGLFHVGVIPIYFLNNDILLTLREVFSFKVPDFYLARKIMNGDFGSIMKDFSGQSAFWAAVFLLSYAALFLKTVFGIGGAFLYLRKNFLAGVLFLTVIFYFPFIIGPEGHSRFRLPVEPVLIIFSAYLVISTYHFLVNGKKTNQNATR